MRCAFLLGTALPMVALVLASTIGLPKKLIYNASVSAPPGLYWLDGQPIERGDYVLVQAPMRVRALVAERGYLPLEAPLIKRVMGVEGDEIPLHRALTEPILMGGAPQLGAGGATRAAATNAAPDWAQRLRRDQRLREGATVAAHTLRDGDRPASGENPRLRDDE